jgi:hypothetical protein
MKTAKLVIGIISMVLSVFVLFQSCAAGMYNALSSNGQASGTGGVFVAICLMIAGIVGVATRNSVKKGGALAAAGFCLAGALVGGVLAGDYSDLYIWSFIAWAFGAVYLVDGFYSEPGKLNLKPWMLVLALIILPPVGIILLWIDRPFKLSSSIITTVIGSVAILVMATNFIGTDSGSVTSDEVATQTSQTTQVSSESAASSSETQAAKTYGLNETWTVDGALALTFTAAAVTDDRNQFDDSNPTQVVILTYDYENLGIDNEYMDLYISSSDFKVIDSAGVMASTYPATTEYPQETPIGAKCIGAQQAYGLTNAGGVITVQVTVYGNNFEKHEAVFELPVG